MIKKVYITPVIEIEKMDSAHLLAGSITSVGGDSGIELGTDETPGTADAPAFGEWRF